jgi:hypothetical protein
MSQPVTPERPASASARKTPRDQPSPAALTDEPRPGSARPGSARPGSARRTPRDESKGQDEAKGAETEGEPVDRVIMEITPEKRLKHFDVIVIGGGVAAGYFAWNYVQELKAQGIEERSVAIIRWAALPPTTPPIRPNPPSPPLCGLGQTARIPRGCCRMSGPR